MIDVFQLYGDSKKVLLVGTYPPPLGGISVFIYRLTRLLNRNHFNVSVFNTGRKSKIPGIRFLQFIFCIIWEKFDVVHIQNFDLKKVIILLIFKKIKGYSVYFTDHNPFQFDKKSGISMFLFKTLLPRIDCLMLVNNHILENYKNNLNHFPPRVLVSNVFIPPPVEEKNEIIATYPQQLLSFINNHKPILIANAYQLKFVDGVDLYGIDMCIRLTHLLSESFENIGFIFCLADEKTNNKKLQEYYSLIDQLKIKENFFFLTGQKQIWPLFESADLFIRPTFRDGYGLSIDEALYFNCRAVASNACERNQEAVIFKNRDLNDLFQKCLNLLKQQGYGKSGN